MEKICRTCNKSKVLDDFSIARKNKDGRNNFCRECRKISDKEYRSKNKDKETIRMRKWRENNPIKSKAYSKKYREDNIEKIKKQSLERQKEYRKDPIYKLKESIRNNIRKSMTRNGTTKTSKTTQILGCSFDEFREHIQSQWEDWMSWDNRGLYNGTLNYGWDLDHIIPISEASTEEELINLNHYTNFQPLCSKVNRDIKKDGLEF